MHEQPSRGFGEDFQTLSRTAELLERQGYYFYPVEREHTEGLVTGPLLERIRRSIKKRGFEKVAGHTAITFTGFARDDREIWQIPETRAYWQALDCQLPELPAILTLLPPFQYNGPGQHLLLLADTGSMVHHPTMGGYDVFVRDAAPIIQDANRRIHQAAAKYHLPHNSTVRLLEQFQAGATYRFPGQH